MSEPGSGTPAERIGTAVRAAAKQGQPALVAFLTAGYPDRNKFREHLTEIAAEADVVEIGVPFSDPMADGVTIQRSSEAALRAGVTLTWILEELQFMAPVRPPLLLMSYMNPLLAFGLERLARRAAGAGICGFIVPDLPLDESEEFRSVLAPYDLALVQIVTPVTGGERLARLARASQGFVYAVTMTGTTGKQMSPPEEIAAYLERVRAAATVPVCAGFGIRTREQVERLRGQVDGVIVGSALVEVLERGESPRAFLSGLRPPRR
ncbi:MAG TPA: tryptophan synthase subunit alpha [Steroidobacteraceae bacterium]|nr:tryptophan synthase subunit alpha [Steroidobacteraceae bacterium]